MQSTLLNHRYRVIKSLGEGGFGRTYLAEDIQMPSLRKCVIKQLKPIAHDPQIYQMVQDRFQREARILEVLGQKSQQVPALYAYFSEANHFYLVQEYIAGKTLADLVVEKGALPELEVQRILAGTLKALQFIHSQNIIHRDIKPGNIIVPQDQRDPFLIDFGAVKEVMSTQLNTPGQSNPSVIIGTPGFMALEQASGHPAFASDLYALGMTTIYLLTGQPPEHLKTAHTGEFQWQQFVQDLSPNLAKVITRSIQPHASDRFSTAQEMLAALKGETAPPPVISQLKPTALTSPNRFKFTLKALWVPLGAAMILGTGGFFLFRPQVYARLGRWDVSQGHWQAAIAHLEQWVQLKPKDTTAQLELGKAYTEVGDYEEAIAIFDDLIQANVAAATAYTERGKVQFQQGRYPESIADFDQAIQRDAKYADAYFWKGESQTELGQYSEASANYQKSLQLDRQNAEAYVGLSGVNITQGNPQEAEQNLDQAIKLNPNLISAYVNRGSRRSDQGDQAGAKADWEKAVQLSPKTAAQWVSQGYARSRLDKKQDAIANYNQALVINPKFAKAYINRGAIQYETGEREKAMKALEQALQLNPNATLAHLLRGEIKAFNPAGSDHQGAIADYSLALKVNPNDPGVLNNRCAAYFALENYQKAIADCSRGLTVNPSSPALYSERGNIRLRLGEYDAAIQDYSRAIKINGDNGNESRSQAIYSNRASARVQLQDLGGALRDINQAIELKPDAAEDYYKRGLIIGAQGDQEGAIADLRKAADLYVQQGRTESYNNVLKVLKQLGVES